MRRMTAHHQVSIQLAQLAAEKAEHEELRVLRDWWRSWSGGDVPPPSPEEHATMPGMPPASALEALAGLSGQAFEARFLDLMIRHHRGAVLMADEAWDGAGDRRLALFADQVRHTQRRQIERMAPLPDAEPAAHAVVLMVAIRSSRLT